MEFRRVLFRSQWEIERAAVDARIAPERTDRPVVLAVVERDVLVVLERPDLRVRGVEPNDLVKQRVGDAGDLRALLQIEVLKDKVEDVALQRLQRAVVDEELAVRHPEGNVT